MVTSLQHDIPRVSTGNGRACGISVGLCRFSRQGDHDLAVDDLDAISTSLAGGLESSRECCSALTASQRRRAPQ
jgi:hypothetical protein